MDPPRTEFVLTSVDWDASNEHKTNRRLVCWIQGGGKLAILGRGGNSAHITAVLAAGFPCTVVCGTAKGHLRQRPALSYSEAQEA